MITTAPLPAAALLRKYTTAGDYTDCYVTDVAGSFTLASYVEAFYTTWVFKLERFLLTHLVAKSSTDLQAKNVANSQTEAFAAWTVEGRTHDQLLMCDFLSRTRSWFMVVPLEQGGTRLYFGSAVVKVRAKSGGRKLGFSFSALMGFHKLYSRILLRAARSRLTR